MMADEEVVEDTIAEETTTIEPTEDEQRALDDGWMSKEKWDESGKDGRFIDAAEYNRAGELMGRIKKQGGRINDLEHRMGTITKTFDATVQIEAERRLTALQAERDEAIRDDDDAKADSLANEIKQVSRDVYKPAEPESTSVTPEIQSWVNDNPWYEDDPELGAIADGIANRMRISNSELTGRAFLVEMTKAVKKIAPEKFPNSRKGSPQSVGKSAAGGTSDVGTHDLPPGYAAKLKDLVETTGLSAKDVIQGWKDIGAISSS